MSLIHRILGAERFDLTDPRFAEHFLPQTLAGIPVGTEAGLRLATYYACVRILAEDVSKLPLVLYRRLPDGGRERVRAADHPVARVLHKPNSFQTGFRFRETGQAHLGHRGNAFAWVTRYGGEIRELLPIHPDRVQVKQDKNYEVRYHIDGKDHKRGRILHVPGLSLDGFQGVSVASYARETLGLAFATERHGTRLFKNGALMRMILRHPGKLKDEKVAKRIRESFDSAFGGDNAHKTALLEEGMEVDKVGMTAEDSQFLGTREFQSYEICRWFRMPPHKVGFRTGEKYNSMEQAALEYLQDTLLPWLIRWEEEMDHTLLTPMERDEYYLEHMVDGVLRGDQQTRYEAYRTAISSGFMSRNEVRQRENMNRAEGLDEYLEPLNMVRASGGRDDD